MNKFQWIIFSLILIFAFAVRLYRIDAPLADWHSWRQADTAAVSKIYIEQGIDLLHPRYFDISNIQSGSDNPEGYRLVEFPLFNLIHVGLYSLVPALGLEVWGRVTTILFSLLATTFIFLICRKYLSVRAGLAAAFFYAVLPYSIYYGRAILPDTPMIASTLGAIYFFALWSDDNFKFQIPNYKFWGTLIFTVAALLFKPYAIFFLLPIPVLAFERLGISALKKWQLWLFAVLAVIPLVLWRFWIMRYPEGIPVSGWLFNGGNIRFKGAYFYWIFGERISKLILGYFPVFAIIGIFKRTFEKHFLFFLSFLASSLLYLVIIARGNVQHDYYQIAIVPSLAIFTGRGIDYILSLEPKINKIIASVMVVSVTCLMVMLSWFFVRDYFNINNPAMVEAGKRADQILPKDAKVIAPLDGDTTFLYYVNRPGWPAFEHSTEDLTKMGATHMVLLHPDENTIKDLSSKHSILEANKDFIIVKL
jgi:hypothetical protein